MPSILQSWVLENCGLRQQGVLVSAVRGCDVEKKHDPSKIISRALRADFLVPHCGDIKKAATFMRPVDDKTFDDAVVTFFDSWDALPMHFIMHLLYAAEIIGYYHPDYNKVAKRWVNFYIRAVHKLHLNPETESELAQRLDADEDTFTKAQN